MIIPEIYPSEYDSYLDYMMDFDNEVLIQPASIPFWFNLILGSLDMIGPETNEDLERTIAHVLECPTRDHLLLIRPAIWKEAEAALGANYLRDHTPIGRKYGVILNLLSGLRPDPFDEQDWAASLSCYAMGVFDLDESGKAELDRRIKVALKDYEPPAV